MLEYGAIVTPRMSYRYTSVEVGHNPQDPGFDKETSTILLKKRILKEVVMSSVDVP